MVQLVLVYNTFLAFKMGFYKETQTFDQHTKAKREDVRCLDKQEDDGILSTRSATNSLEASTASTSSTIFASIRTLFTSTSIEHTPLASSGRYQRPSTSSGYNSFTDSWDVDDSYIKVCKFSGN